MLDKTLYKLILLTPILLLSPMAVAEPRSVTEPSAFTLYLGPSLGVNYPVSDLNSLGGSVALLRSIPDSNFSVGLETGFFVATETHGQMLQSGSVMTLLSESRLTVHSVPLLVAANYDFKRNDFTQGDFVPYLGLATGITIVSADLDGEQESTARFMLMIKPGVRISSFFVESKVALVGGSFSILPTFGVALNF